LGRHPAASGSTNVNLVYFTAAMLVTLAVAGFQLQLLSFSGLLELWFLRSILYHGCWALAIALTLFLLITRPGAIRRFLPVLLACALCAGIAVIHPIDGVSRRFLSALALAACGTVLAACSAPLALLRLSAAATGLSAAFCLLDILFVRGFTETVGRAAGLSVNPNVAAAGLLLGAASSFWTVPRDWRTPFVLIVTVAILATLSRSVILSTILICIAIGAVLIRARLKAPEPRPPTRWLRAGVVCLCLAAWIGAAAWSNHRFSRAATIAVQHIASALPIFKAARESVSANVQIVQSRARGCEPATRSSTDAALAQIARRAEAEGARNSLAARGLFFEGAVLAYRTGPPLGCGLAAAHALSPHNTFLLFAIGFGHLGWLIPVAFLVLSAWWVRTPEQVPIVLATFAVLVTSHDLLLVPGLLLPVILGMTALSARVASTEDQPCGVAAIKYAVLAAPVLFALGWLLGHGPAATAITPAPDLLWGLVLGASTFWAAAIWLWSGKQVGGTA
jgi:hypothetical protein